MIRRYSLILFAALFFFSVVGANAQTYKLKRTSVNAGYGKSTGAANQIKGTAGQFAQGVMSDAQHKVYLGIWYMNEVVPTVTTDPISSIGSTSATGGGEVTSEGASSVTARGVCWNTTGDPTTADSKTTDGSGTGTFTSSLTGLTPGTLYYARSYAENDEGVGYGEEVTFRTLSSEPTAHSTYFRAEKNDTDDGIVFIYTAPDQITNCSGYLLIARECEEPAGLPSDGQAYDDGDAIGNGFAAATITNTALDEYELAAGGAIALATTYQFKLIPFSWDGSNDETINYYTDPTIPMEPGNASEEVNLYMDDVTLVSGDAETYDVYKALLADWDDVTVGAGAELNITSKTNIVFKPGFKAERTSAVKAEVTPGELCEGARRSDHQEAIAGLPVDFDLTMKLYPNPTKGAFIIDLSYRPEDPVTIEITNMLGQTRTYSQMLGDSFRIDLSDGTQGVYLVTGKSGSMILRDQIVYRP